MPSSPAIDPTTVPASVGSSYPPEFAAGSAQRQKRRLGDVFGLTAFGVNMTTLPPGTESALRHYHTEQDEFVYIVAGTLVLVTDDGEQELTAGMVAGFKRGEALGHHLINRGESDAVYLEVGDRNPADVTFYPGLDLTTGPSEPDSRRFFKHLDGTPY